MKTYSAKPAEVERRWWLIDAEGLVLGRLAVIAADRLRGKHKPMFTPHIDTGDHVVVVNADKVVLKGAKRDQKMYYRHTGHPGGIKGVNAAWILESAHPERVIEAAVRRMIPTGPLGRAQFKKLHVYKGAEHPHGGAQPEPLDVAGMNRKNAA
jgi:large subunit ribosomal protein L13